MIRVSTFAAFLCGALMTLLSVPVSARTLLVLPVSGAGIADGDLASVNRLFREALEMRYTGPVVAGTTSCEDRGCALQALGAAQADEVVYSSIYLLGTRWIFSASVTGADGAAGFSQRLTGANIEDMEALTIRMADALTTRRTTEQVASLDNITAKEADADPTRRRSLYHAGVALGYVFPVGTSYSYVSESPYVYPPERKRYGYDQMVRLTWLNSWEFRNDFALGADLVWTTPYAIGADVSLRYMLNRSDFTPFIGGGLGLHYVRGDVGVEGDENKRNSGPALNVQGGMMLFRTYDVNVMLRGQYQVIFNSDVDHGPALDVGVSFRDRDKGKASKGNDGLGFWGYTGITLATLMVIGLLAD